MLWRAFSGPQRLGLLGLVLALVIAGVVPLPSAFVSARWVLLVAVPWVLLAASLLSALGIGLIVAGLFLSARRGAAARGAFSPAPLAQSSKGLQP